MTTIEKFVDVPAPAAVAYAHWTQMEQFPAFMHNVTQVQRTGPDTLHWEAQVGSAHREWDAVITQREPGRSISWQSTSGARNDGTVTFEDGDDGTCRVTLVLDFEPGNWVDQLGDMLGFVGSSVEGDLERFAQHVERMPLAPPSDTVSDSIDDLAAQPRTDISPDARTAGDERPDDVQAHGLEHERERAPALAATG